MPQPGKQTRKADSVDTSGFGRLLETFLVFGRLGLTSFGGPTAHIGYFRKELVVSRNWVSESQFTQLLALCQFLPGPASSQLGFALGLLRAGWPGALAAFAAFTLPSALLLYASALLLPGLEPALAATVTGGLKLVACVIVADALLGMSRSLCPGPAEQLMAGLSAAILLVSGSAWVQLSLVAVGAIAGLTFLSNGSRENAQVTAPFGKVVGFGLLAAFSLLLVCPMLIPDSFVLGILAETCFHAGALVFGGGHVVLPLLEERLVSPGWVSRDDFLAGYGAAQAVPGPLFTFAAYLGAVFPTGQPAWVGAFLALVCIFLPGLLLLAGVLPFWQSLARNQSAGKALAGVNAVVVGLLAATLYDPVFLDSISSASDLAIVIVGFTALTSLRLSPLYLVGWCLLAKLATS